MLRAKRPAILPARDEKAARQAAERGGFLVRLPIELVLRDPLESLARIPHLVVKLTNDHIAHAHLCFSLDKNFSRVNNISGLDFALRIKTLAMNYLHS